MAYVPMHFFPDLMDRYGSLIFGAISDAVINGATEKYAWFGTVSMKEPAASKDIEAVSFRFGSITKTTGGGTPTKMTVSLQNLDSSNGPVARPDGTPDQTVDILAADGDFASNTYYVTDPLSVVRTVANGDALAVVLEFDDWNSGDSVAITGAVYASAQASGTAVYDGAAWATTDRWGGIALHFDDGSMGTLTGGGPVSGGGEIGTTGNDGTPDEFGIAFTMPVDCKMDGIAFMARRLGGNYDFDVCLYEGLTGTALVDSVSHEANHSVTDSPTRFEISFPETELTAGTVYVIAIKAMTTNDSPSVTYIDVPHADYWEAHMWGDETWHYVARTDAAANWTSTTTRRPIIMPRISAVDVGGGASGGFPVLGGPFT
jgi:hypothetical protein